MIQTYKVLFKTGARLTQRNFDDPQLGICIQWLIQGKIQILGPNSFILMQFLAKLLQNNRLAHPPWKLAPL